MNRLLTAGAAAALAMAMATSAAAAVTYNFGALTPGDVGSATHTYTVSGLSIIATAVGPNNVGGTPDHLYGKNAGGGEQGLGMTNDTTGDHEIEYGRGFIQLDLSGLVGKLVSFTIGSSTSGEGWKVIKTNSLCTLANLQTTCAGASTAASGTSELTSISLGVITAANRYYDFVETTNVSTDNFLIGSVTTFVPEPATWAMMLVGFGGLGAAMRRRRATARVAAA